MIIDKVKAIMEILASDTFILFSQKKSDAKSNHGCCLAGGDRSDCDNLLEFGYRYFKSL